MTQEYNTFRIFEKYLPKQTFGQYFFRPFGLATYENDKETLNKSFSDISYDILSHMVIALFGTIIGIIVGIHECLFEDNKFSIPAKCFLIIPYIAAGAILGAFVSAYMLLELPARALGSIYDGLTSDADDRNASDFDFKHV